LFDFSERYRLGEIFRQNAIESIVFDDVFQQASETLLTRQQYEGPFRQESANTLCQSFPPQSQSRHISIVE